MMSGWRDEHTHPPYQTNGQFSLTAAAISSGWECLGELIYMATTDHYLALWKARKSISLPHKNHLNTNRILRGRLREKKKKNRNGMTALSLAPSTPDCSLILLCPSCPSVGHSVSARESRREQSELIKDLPPPRSQEIHCYGDAEISQHARWDWRHGHS